MLAPPLSPAATAGQDLCFWAHARCCEGLQAVPAASSAWEIKQQALWSRCQGII